MKKEHEVIKNNKNLKARNDSSLETNDNNDVILNDQEEQEELDMAAQMSKSMSWFMPIMAVSISLIAPLGLALYWLVNNILMIFERLVLNKILDSKKEA